MIFVWTWACLILSFDHLWAPSWLIMMLCLFAADNNTNYPQPVGPWFHDKLWKGGWHSARANGVTNEPPRRELKPPDWLYLRVSWTQRALSIPALQIISPFCFIFWSFCGAGCPIQSPEMFIKMSPIYSIDCLSGQAAGGDHRVGTVVRGLRQVQADG